MNFGHYPKKINTLIVDGRKTTVVVQSILAQKLPHFPNAIDGFFHNAFRHF